MQLEGSRVFLLVSEEDKQVHPTKAGLSLHGLHSQGDQTNLSLASLAAPCTMPFMWEVYYIPPLWVSAVW